MSLSLKPVADQVIVITGASSGIGLATAREAALRGAKVVLAARSEGALRDIVAQIEKAGGQAVAVPCDVSDRAQVDHVVQTAIEHFGRIDTWINNAGLSIYGKLEEVDEKDSRRLFDTNFWGIVNGSLAVLPHLKQNGGALINLGSEVSEAVIPLQGMYAASKHAVKGFTDALRVEVAEVESSKVSITLIQPTAVDTPFPQHARNYMDREPKLPTPQIKAQQVAEAILDAAAKPTHHTKVGLMSKVNTFVADVMPKVADKMSAKQANRQQYDEQPRNREGSLFQPSERTSVVGQVAGAGGREES